MPAWPERGIRFDAVSFQKLFLESFPELGFGAGEGCTRTNVIARIEKQNKKHDGESDKYLF
jgi:hypothetical protein